MVLQKGLSKPELYGQLVHKVRKIVGKAHFSVQFKAMVSRCKKIVYNMDILWHTACMVVNQITVDNFASHFNSTTASRS